MAEEEETLLQYDVGHRWSFLAVTGEEETRLVKKPVHEELCLMVFEYMVVKGIEHQMKSSCDGCHYGGKTTASHKSWLSCLTEWDSAVDLCLLLAVKMVTPLHLFKAYARVLDLLRFGEMAPSKIVTKMAKLYTPAEAIKDTIKNLDHSLEYTEVFVKALGSCTDLYGPLGDL